jgi:glycosyltransferase involved in cell wall biosynthesis
MRILFITPDVPHPTRGGAAIRNWHLIDAAIEAGHQADTLTFGHFRPHDGEPRALPATASGGPTTLDRLRNLAMRGAPDLVMRLGAERLRPTVIRLMDEHRYDAMQIEGLEMWPALPDLAIPAIYDAHNAETTLQRRIAGQAAHDGHFVRAAYSYTQARLLREYERAVMRHAAATIAVSPSDAAALHMLAPCHRMDVVPIGVDTAYYAPDAVTATAETNFDVLFTGTMDYYANVDAALWFTRAVWPRIRAVRPAARLGIVGRGPTARIRKLHGRDGIVVTGQVEDDRPAMAGATIYVLPIRVGAGVRVKLLNAMAMRCAVVATPAACEGVTISDGDDLVIAEPDGERFAAAILGLLGDDARRHRLGTAARERMRASYEWSVCTPTLLHLYARLEHGDA